MAVSSGEIELLRVEIEVVMVVISMDLLGRERPVSEVNEVTAPVRVLTPGTASIPVSASVGTVSTWVAMPATGVGTEGTMGAPRTWQLRLKETAATVRNFMLMVEFWYWER